MTFTCESTIKNIYFFLYKSGCDQNDDNIRKKIIINYLDKEDFIHDMNVVYLRFLV